MIGNKFKQIIGRQVKNRQRRGKTRLQQVSPQNKIQNNQTVRQYQYKYCQMSYTPDKVKIQLEHEIEKRISHESPTKYDIDFYLRKILRLENDLNQSHDELSKARVRLRRAEDFEIKYDLLLRQNTILLNDIDKKQKQCHSLRSKGQIIKAQLDDRAYQGESWTNEKKALTDQIEKLKSKIQDLQEKKKVESVVFNEKADIKVKSEIESIKKDFGEKEEQLNNQIRQLRKVIHEKETVQNVVTSKVDKIRNEKDKQIGRLTKLIDIKKEETNQILKEKNDEIDKLRQKFEKMFNFEIENLRNTLQDQDEVFSIEINGLRELLGLKNQQIKNLLRELKETTNEHQLQRQQLIKEINALKDKIYSTQRQNQIQLYNIKERLTKIHSLEIDTLQKKFTDLVHSLKSEKINLQKLLQERAKIEEQQRKDHERVKQQLVDRLKERDARINHLQERIKESGDLNANEMKTLHESFHQIETEKESMSNEYQANVGFLNQQIAKLTSNNEVKNNQIKMLYEQIGLIKKHSAEALREIEDRWKEEREEREKDRERERQKRDKLQEEIRMKEKQWKAKQRDLERAREMEQREKNKIKFICQQLERDIQRQNQYIKQIDENLKREYKKNQVGTLDSGGVRRQLTAELERQKSELQAIKRMQVDQIRKKLQIEITRLTQDNQRLQTDLLKKELALNELQDEFKKLQHINKNIEKINKQKLVAYQKKMATLNNEILISQNLYKSFLQAKGRQKQNVGSRY